MKKNSEILQLAKQKAAALQEGCQIRLTSEAFSYWVFKFQGHTYIGTMCCEFPGLIMPKFFPNKTVYDMLNKAGEKVGQLQSLPL